MVDPLIRNARADDAADIFNLVAVCDLAEIGAVDFSMDDVVEDLSDDSLRAWVAPDPQGGVAAYAWVRNGSGHASIDGDVLVRPGGDPALAETLLDKVRRSAQAISADRPLMMFVNTANVAKAAMFRQTGAEVVRHFWRMVIDLPAAPGSHPAEGVTVRPVGEADLPAVHRVLDTGFADHFAHEPEDYDHWLAHRVSGQYRDLSLWWLASVGDEPAAALRSTLWAESAIGFVSHLATLREHRGHGLGRLMLHTAFDEFHRRGMRQASLGVDSVNSTGAVGLYTSVGMRQQFETVVYDVPPLG